MKFDKIQKLTILILAITCMAFAGQYIKKQVTSYEIVKEDETYTGRVRVTLSGAVAKPGEYTVDNGARICDVIYGAGGVTEDAELNEINLDAIVMDGTKIHIPHSGEDSVKETIPLIDINTADKSTLELIPGVGEALSVRIIDHREENGPFKTLEDLCEVDGIGKAKAEQIMEYIKLEELPK